MIYERIFLFVLMIFFFQSSHASGNGFDVITMKNGDVHNGTLAQEVFIIETPYGEFSVPYIHMAELQLSDHQYQDRLLTHFGDRFYGNIKAKHVLILRSLSPSLPVAVNDIFSIQFVSRLQAPKAPVFTELLSSRYGDHFKVNLILDVIEITADNKKYNIALKDIVTVDVAHLLDGEQIMVQLRTYDNRIIQGELSNVLFTFQNNYNQEFSIPLLHINSIDFKQADSSYIAVNGAYKDELRSGGYAPHMIRLSAGQFLRGDDAGDEDEKPAMPVSLKAFAIGSREVSFDEYDQFCDDTRCSRPDDGEWGRGSRPVVNVSWEDAMAYSQWLSQKTGKVYRLPTDAEWEYAARAGTVTRFWWGNEVGMAMANCEGCKSIWGGDKTAPVGRFPANAFGLYDTAGNVFEWVADCYHNTFEHAPKDGSAIDKPGCGKRVIRGGAWSFPAKEIRSANRWRDFPTRRSDDTGFRVVRELD
ncbi:MAG: formylglycine-generating enzyme family protein [Gammaproteobacteria bacterium]|nr:formylglycine-generating enzyme family protein [Gammaproteobacteria bacterium]